MKRWLLWWVCPLIWECGSWPFPIGHSFRTRCFY
jgi:hypothetical protein